MNDRPGVAHLADVVAVLEQLYDLRWAESWDACARSDRSAPRDDLRVHLEVLDLTPLHRRSERLHALGDRPV